MIVRTASVEDYKWIYDRLPCEVTHGFKAIEAVRENGTIVGMIGFDRWTPNSCELHIYLTHPAALRALIYPAADFVFNTHKRDVIMATVKADHKRVRRLVESIGFQQMHRIRNGWDWGVDLVTYELRRADCRFLEQKRRVA